MSHQDMNLVHPSLYCLVLELLYCVRARRQRWSEVIWSM